MTLSSRPAVSSASLKTRTINTDTIFQNPVERENLLRREKLRTSDQGGLLMFEIANFGGDLFYKTNETQVRLNLPSRLSRNVTAAYLNCAGDLIRQTTRYHFEVQQSKRSLFNFGLISLILSNEVLVSIWKRIKTRLVLFLTTFS